MKAILIRKSTQQVLKRANYPKSQIQPINGLADDLEWLLVVEQLKPSYNSETQKLNKIEAITATPHPAYDFLNVYSITYEVVDLPQEEIDAKAEAKLDSDNSATLQLKYKSDGIVAFDKIYALILRAKANGELTPLQTKNLAIGLYAPLEPLYKGLWELVKLNLSNETPPTNAKLLEIFNKIVTKVDNYIDQVMYPPNDII